MVTPQASIRHRSWIVLLLMFVFTLAYPTPGVSQGSEKSGGNKVLQQLQDEIKKQQEIESSKLAMKQLHERIEQAMDDLQSIKKNIARIDAVVKEKGCNIIPRMASELGQTVAGSRKALLSITAKCAGIDPSSHAADHQVCRTQEALIKGRLDAVQKEYDALLSVCDIATQ